jgi:hypothetical protein
LTFNEDKTQIVHVGQPGFDFLRFNIRRYNGRLLIKPSKAVRTDPVVRDSRKISARYGEATLAGPVWAERNRVDTRRLGAIRLASTGRGGAGDHSGRRLASLPW